MSYIESMIKDVIDREGGYVDHPDDRGGPTKFGVTLKTLSDYRGLPQTAKDVQGISKRVAHDIYETNYYIKPRIHLLPEIVQPFMLDSAIHHGPSRAIIFLQKVICRSRKGDRITVDGVNGPITQSEAKKVCEELGELAIVELMRKRRAFLMQIVLNDSSQSAFMGGWLKRVNSFGLTLKNDIVRKISNTYED